MYKDKPYHYPTSTRYVPVWRRKRVLAVALVCLLLCYYLLSGSSPATRLKVPDHRTATDEELALLIEHASAVEDWDLRRGVVREVFKQSWDAYEKYAWGELSVGLDTPTSLTRHY